MQIYITNNGSPGMYEAILHAILGDNTNNLTFIDLCCANCNYSQHLELKEKTYVDIADCWYKPDPVRFVQTSVLSDHVIFSKHYDISFCSDGIEHLRKKEGLQLVERMKSLSDKQILFTPLGDYLVEDNNENPECHKSGWLPDDFPGFASIVIPNFHATMDVVLGAFFVWRCRDIESDFKRVEKCLTGLDYDKFWKSFTL